MKKILITLIAASATLTVSAQMDNVVEVESTYKPTVKDANKINVLPQTETTTVKHYNVEYANQPKPVSDYVFEPAKASASDVAEKGDPKGFLTLAGGNGGNILARGAYGWDITDKDILNFDISLRGHNKKVDYFLDKDLEWKQRFYQTNIDLKYEHKLNIPGTVFVNAGASQQVYNYQYWQNTNVYITENHENATSVTDKQHNRQFYAQAGVTPLKFNQFTLSGNIGFNGFTRRNYLNNEYRDEYGNILQIGDDLNKQGRFDADFRTNYKINEQHSAGVDFSADYISYDLRDYKNQGDFEIKPHYAYNNEQLELVLGAKLIFETGLRKKFRVAPEASITYHLNPQIDLFATANGGLYFNDFFMMNALTPYWNLPMYQQQAQFNQIEADAGLKWKIKEGWFSKFHAGYDSSKDRAELTIPNGVLCRNDVFTADGSLVHFDAEMKYSYKDVFVAEAKGRYNGWSIKKNNNYYYSTPAWRPTFVVDANIMVQPFTGLRIGVDYQLRTFEHDSKVAYERPTISNLGASISYKIPRDLLPVNLSVYCRADNLLNQSYDAYYGYRAPGTMVLCGAAVNF